MSTLVTDTVDLNAVKARQQATWATGDYGVIGTTLVIVGEQLCEAVDLRAGQRVLDVATGHGITALAAARRWCEVTGLDYVPALVERGRDRAAADRLTVTFQEGDAERMPYPDGAFDVVLSTFGVMFTADQEKAARELLRVCRPGGKIGLASWTPDGFIGQIFRTIGRYLPPPPGVKSPALWGTESRLRELLGEGIETLQVTPRQFNFRYRSFEHWLDVFRTYYGPTLKAFEALDAEGQAGLKRDLKEQVNRLDRGGQNGMVVPSEYLEVVAIRRSAPGS
jgi:ubiquinone/menaquinone biosynthesis C-methylase UbiE